MKPIHLGDLKVPMSLIALSLVPMAGGIVRLVNLAGHGPVTEANARFVESPVPILIHIGSVTFYCLLGAFQFSRGVRVRWPAWHRSAGKVLVLSGLLSALTGMWMTGFYAIPAPLQGQFLYGVRMVVGAAMVGALILGWRSILHRDIPGHEAWMIRAYALGQGAGTQALILLPIILIMGEVLGTLRDVLMTMAWVVNLVVAELVIRSSKPAPRSRAMAVSSPIGPG